MASDVTCSRLYLDGKNEEKMSHKQPRSALNWVIDKAFHKRDINPKYADNTISFVRSDKARIHQVEQHVRPIVKPNNLEKRKAKQKNTT